MIPYDEKMRVSAHKRQAHIRNMHNLVKVISWNIIIFTDILNSVTNLEALQREQLEVYLIQTCAESHEQYHQIVLDYVESSVLRLLFHYNKIMSKWNEKNIILGNKCSWSISTNNNHEAETIDYIIFNETFMIAQRSENNKMKRISHCKLSS